MVVATANLDCPAATVLALGVFLISFLVLLVGGVGIGLKCVAKVCLGR